MFLLQNKHFCFYCCVNKQNRFVVQLFFQILRFLIPFKNFVFTYFLLKSVGQFVRVQGDLLLYRKLGTRVSVFVGTFRSDLVHSIIFSFPSLPTNMYIGIW